MSAASIFAIKRCITGGINLAIYLLKTLRRNHFTRPQIGAGTLINVFAKTNGETHYLLRAIDHEGTILDYYVSKRRDRKVARKVLKRLVSRHGLPKAIVTDKLASYAAALKELNMRHLQNTHVIRTIRLKIHIFIFEGEKRE